jgi:hypothetical protein
MWGILSLFNSKGANRIINSTSEKMITGFFRGNVKSKPDNKTIILN